MRIGLDFDGVLADCGQLKSDGARELFGVHIPPARFKKELVIPYGLLTAEQYRTVQEFVYHDRRAIPLMREVPGALASVRRLAAAGHDLIVVTSRKDDALDIACEWADSAAFSALAGFVGVGFGNSKAPALRGFDFYVDDDLDKLEDLDGVVPERRLFSWEYNRHIDAGCVPRVEDWGALCREVELLA